MKFNLNQPPEHVARDIAKEVEDFLWDSDVKVKFGQGAIEFFEGIVDQYNNAISREHDEAARQGIENQRLRAALEEIAEWWSNYSADDQIVSIQNVARKALGKPTQEL